MRHHTDTYLQRCLEEGYLTTDKIYKYSLKPSYLAILLKTYAVDNHLPYDANMYYLKHIKEYDYYYLTEAGFAWALSVYSRYSFEFLRSTFNFMFTKAKDLDEALDPNHAIYDNFRGIRGASGRYAKPTPCVLVWDNGKEVKEFPFDSLLEAREYAKTLFGFHSPDEFTLYSIINKKRNGKISPYRQKAKIIFDNNWGVSLRKWRENNDKY